MRVIAAFLLSLVFVSAAHCQYYVCGPGGCYQVSEPSVVTYPLPDGWVPSVEQDVLCYIQGGRYIGAFRKSTGAYHVVTRVSRSRRGAPRESARSRSGQRGRPA